MRRLVPAFLMIGMVLCLAPEAKAITLQEIWNQIGCSPTPTDEALKVRCLEARFTYCKYSASPTAAECQSSNADLNAPMHNPSGPGWDTTPIMNAGARARASACIGREKEAQNCCADNADACQGEIASKGGKSAKAWLATINADTEGLKNDCDKSAEVNSNGAKLTYGVAGVCDAAQMVCNQQCDKIITLLENCVNDGTRLGQVIDACVEALADAKRTKAACQGKSSSVQVAAAEEYKNGKKLSLICSGVAGDDKDGDGKPDKPTDPADPGGENPPAKTDPGTNAGMQPSSTASSMMPMIASMLPALMQMMNPQETPQQAAVLDRVDCTVNPNLAGCQTAAATAQESWNEKGGMAEASVQATDTGTFNLPDGADGFTPQGGVPTGTPSNPPTVASVPNGGGGIPGGGGGGPASLGGGGGSGGAQLGSKADVLHGLGSASGGAFSQTNAGMNMKSGESGGYSYGGGPGMDSGLNLGDFLPGGRQDPTKRNIAGVAGGAPANYQIQAKDVNIWNRISERIKSRCSQGLLRDCVP